MRTARPQFVYGGDGMGMWRVTANIFNNQSWGANKRWPKKLRCWSLKVLALNNVACKKSYTKVTE